ncbi:hypothetical protein [Pseudomonas laurylsulfatiphila]|uniref:hypothetical protein n=1 Tax=Pseudomonas laurylsulfatiphila TaxID=2011015 RepID=UPI003D1B19A5
MITHNAIAVIVFLAFAYSVFSGVKAIVRMDNCKSGPRCLAFLITTIGVLYLVETAILFFQGDNVIIHPLSAIVSTLSVAVNLIAIKNFPVEELKQ